MQCKTEWFNDDDFWERYAPIMFDDKRWEEVPLVVQGIKRLVGLPVHDNDKLPSALDLCCGFGRITLELAREGFCATGVDITASYLTAAKEDARHEGLTVEFIHEDVRNFKRPAAFDLVLNLYNSFGFFEDESDDLLFARNAWYSLKEEGSFLIEVQGKELAVSDYTESAWFKRAGYFVLTECKVLDSWASVENRWTLIKDGVKYEKEFCQRLYSAVELRALLYRAGFSVVDIYGGWDGRSYDANADTLIVIGRKDEKALA